MNARRCCPGRICVRTGPAIRMKLAMRIVQWLERPASAFVYAAES
jgi:hypothetical protein